MNRRYGQRAVVLCCFGAAALLNPLTSFGLTGSEVQKPAEVDVRGPDGVPTGTAFRQPTAAQIKALASLEALAGGLLVVQYNGLTATPRHLFSHGNYLSAPSSASAETIAREFLAKWAGIWRFSESDLQNLRLKSRATLPDTGTTIVLLEQQVDGVSVHKGEVLVNVSASGRVISVGNENFPQMSVRNGFTMSPDQAVSAAAASLGLGSFTPQSLGTSNVLRTYGDLPQEFVEGARFSGGGVFSDEIVAHRVIFPMGEEGRAAYKFNLTTPQYEGIMWENIVDASTGQVLRRISLTAFQAGGGVGVGRHGSLRPDVQDRLEAQNLAGTSQGKVFDAMPTQLSGWRGFGRAQNPGDAPTYAAENTTVRASGRGFKFSMATRRIESALIYPPNFGQVLRGLPDALNPTPESPFGWFYLPTDTGGAEVPDTDFDIASTRAFGYTIHAAADARNVPANSPTGNGDQPFSASLTTLPATANLLDGRMLTSVFQSHYTEGNNVIVADDQQNDNESTHGIKGFSLNRQFTAAHFDFINGYEFGDVDGAAGVFPVSTYADVIPGTVNLFWAINLMHDYLYGIGFTEQLWNFQQDNFGKGGAGKDAVSGQVQDGSGINNANFATPSDGSRPRMQMFLFTEASQRRADGDFDFDVVAHELYHGVSNRSVGKGESGCLGITMVGESGGQGEGWSDFFAESMSDDDATGEYVVGDLDAGIRRMPKTNFRWSYASINQKGLTRRDQQVPPDVDTGTGTPFAVHRTGEVWSATLWDMRELLIMKDPNGVFFDGGRRLGANGTNFYIGYRQVKSRDAQHPINYRAEFNTNDPATIKPAEHMVRPSLVADEIASRGDRVGPLAMAVRNGARLADTLVLRGMQLSPCNPSYVDSRNSILEADRELTGGENLAVIWRAFASHGVGLAASSTASASQDPGSQSAVIVVEDFNVPAGVTQCEQLGPLPAPTFTVANTTPNEATLTITPVVGAVRFIISRATGDGPFSQIDEIPATQLTYSDNNANQGLQRDTTYRYQVRATRNPECVSVANIQSVTIAIGSVLIPSPLFGGITQVADPQLGDRLILSWRPAVSSATNATMVYDVFRVDHVAHGTGQTDTTFTPDVSNRIAEGLTSLSFTDTGRTLNQTYYYIVQARDTTNNRKDTNNTGNTRARWSAPTIPCFAAPAPFTRENFEAASANTRFAPPLVDSGSDPNENAATFQRVTGVNLGSFLTSMMYGPSFSPPDQDGGPSDFSTVIGPIMLTPTSVMDFDHMFSSEQNFDGGVMEISVGSAQFNAQVFPDNVTTFDLGDYMIEGAYNERLDGEQFGVMLSALQGRRAFTGFKGLHHTRIALKNFAPGGVHNPGGAPVFIRWRMTSDAGTSVGPNTGWFIDNVTIRTMGVTGFIEPPTTVSRKNHGNSGSFDIPLPLTGTSGVESRRGGGNGGDHTIVFIFNAPLVSVSGVNVTAGQGTVSSSSIDGNEYIVNLTNVPDDQVIAVTLTGVNDTCGNSAASISAQMGLLLGDTNGDRSVNSGDAQETRNRSGESTAGTNFRSDVNTDGTVNSGDAFIVRGRSGNGL